MEYIQEALQKAKTERVGGIGRVQDYTRGNSSYRKPGSKLPVDISYTLTRQIRLTDEELKARRIVAGFAHDPRSEPYRQLRTQILQKMKSNAWRTLAITSPTSASGKTLTAINLAISLSQDVNQTVVLVDLDLKNPAVAQTLGVEHIDCGVVDYLDGKIGLEQILINPGFNRLVILPGLPSGPCSSEVLSSPAMQSLHEELVSRYDNRLVIYDLPALLQSDDAMMFAPAADATLLVVEDGKASREDLERCQQLLEGVNLIGNILNKAR